MKRILVALDGSARAPGVLDAASRLAAMSGARLVLYHAITIPPDLPRELLLDGNARLEDVLVAKAHGALEELAGRAPREQIEHLVTAFAIPWDGICHAARERDVDLIVIGAHGYGTLDRLLGTVAAKVVNHADRNVLVVRTTL